MDAFLATLVFLLPGLLAYFWLRMFGVNPPVAHSGTEITAIAALLWIPTSILSVLAYDGMVWGIGKKAPAYGLTYLADLKTLTILSTQLTFLLIFLILSLVFSFVVAYIWAVYLYKMTLSLINKVRSKRNMAQLDELTTVWDNFFLAFDRNEKGSEPIMLVEVYKMGDDPEKRIYGTVKKTSRPFELERALVLTRFEGWKESHEYYQYPVKRTYVDLKSGLVVNELDSENPKVKE